MDIGAFTSKRLALSPLEATQFELWQTYEKVGGKRRALKSDFNKLLRRHRKNAREQVRWEWRIFEKKSGAMIGLIDVKTITRGPHQIADVGYLILPSYQGKGYATEAAAKLIPQIFRQLKFHRLEFAIDLENKASVRVAENLGLYREGVRKYYWPQNYPKSGGRWIDQLMYVTTPELYRSRRKV